MMLKICCHSPLAMPTMMTCPPAVMIARSCASCAELRLSSKFASWSVSSSSQGLTIVHFSAQPEPFLSLKFHGPPSVSHKRRL
jgi:hypothetical protein